MSSSRTETIKPEIIHASPTGFAFEDWQIEHSRSICEPRSLLEALALPEFLLAAAERAAREFPLRVTRHFVSLMRPGDPQDPLLQQVLPLGEELETRPGFVADPVGDRAAIAGTGLLQKYHGRALVLTTGACAVHCRYCFRRHFPYGEESVTRSGWDQTLDELTELAAETGLCEVILSGGDPLSLSDTRLIGMIEDLGQIAPLRRLRLHTRLPVVLPQRLTPRLIAALRESRLEVVLVLHTNHPRELAPILRERLAPLRRESITLLNQAVLLRGVNDSAETLVELSEALFAAGILPYYLHQLDPVDGAAHFAVSTAHATELLHRLQARLPGYLVPKLVQEIPGAASKLPLAEASSRS